MKNDFKIWSETSPTVKQALRPTLDLRSWDELEEEDKSKIARFLLQKGWLQDGQLITKIMFELNENYKVNTYAKFLFSHGGPHQNVYSEYESCCKQAASTDLASIIKTEKSEVVFELLSLYARELINNNSLRSGATAKEIDQAYDRFDRFSRAVNDVLTHFGVNITLNRLSFAPRQEKVIEELVLQPTFIALSGSEWEEVQKEFSDAISEYRKGNKQSYSNAITHIVTAVQAFLQIKILGETGKGDIDDLLKRGIRENKISSDELTKKVLTGLSSTLMEYRQKQGDAHPKKEYANEKSVRLTLNVAAVFIQYVI